MKKALHAGMYLGIGILVSIAMHSVSGSETSVISGTSNGPIVSTQSIAKSDQLVTLTGWGQIQPKEQSQISAQISGKVVFINENAEIGNIIHKGEVLFALEAVDYEHNLVQAESELALANSELEEEIALGKVAKEEWKQIDATPTKLALRLPQLATAKAKVQGATAKVAQAKLQLSRTKIYAPYDAVVHNKSIGLGQTISANQTAMHLYRADHAQINVPVSGFELSLLMNSITSNEEISIIDTPVEIIATRDSRIFTKGRLVRINKTQDSKTRMTSLVIQTPNLYSNFYNPELQFGSFVEVRLPRIRLHDVYKVPQHLIVDHSIWNATEQNTLQKTPVSVLWEDERFSYVRAELPDTVQLITTIPDYAKEGSKITVNNEAFAEATTGAIQ